MAKDATALERPSTLESYTSKAKPKDNIYWPVIATKDDIPGWLRDNDFIIGSHLIPTHSYERSFRLWRCLHMETMNIWTHLLGAILAVVAGVSLYCVGSSSSALSLSTGDKLTFAASITAAASCFGLSATFHALRSHSYHVHHFWGKLDIFGICVLAAGGGASATYYAFYCNNTAQRVYWSLDLALGVIAAIVLFDTGGGGNKMRALRGGVFVLLAFSAMLPIIHRVGLSGWNEASDQIGAQYFLAEALFLVSGVSLFITRIPERLSPGTFDIWGHSHQLHHTCAVIGTGFHVAALVTGYKYRQAHPQC